MAIPIVPPPEDPFWIRFDARVWRGEEIGCAIWTARRTKKGYGEIWLNGRLERAHRIAFIRSGGILTEDCPHVLHRCDRPACVEFACLFAGTNAENREDMARKERGRKSRLGRPYGVTPRKGGGFKAWITIGGKQRYLGCWPSEEAAAQVARSAKDAHYGA